MKVIDARSGRELSIGERVEYPDGEWMKLVDVDPGLFSASAVVMTCMRDPFKGTLVTQTQQVPLSVHWMHPRFLFEHVAFIPS